MYEGMYIFFRKVRMLCTHCIVLLFIFQSAICVLLDLFRLVSCFVQEDSINNNNYTRLTPSSRGPAFINASIPERKAAILSKQEVSVFLLCCDHRHMHIHRHTAHDCLHAKYIEMVHTGCFLQKILKYLIILYYNNTPIMEYITNGKKVLYIVRIRTTFENIKVYIVYYVQQ